MTDTLNAATEQGSLAKVLAALVTLGDATAAAVAERAGLGYSTTTPRLRALEQAEQAERFRTDGRTFWRATDAGRATAVEGDANDAADESTTEPDHGDDPDAGDESVAPAQPANDDVGTQSDDPDTAAHEQKPNPLPVQPGPDDLGKADTDADASAPDQPAHDGVPELVTTNESCSATDLTPAVDDVAEPADEHLDGGEPSRDPQPGSGHPDADLSTGDLTDTAAPTVNSPGAGSSPSKQRRPSGSLRGAILDVLEAHPDREYKVGELCKLIDKANEGTPAAKASPGAVYNAAVKLAGASAIVQTVDKPATFQIAPAAG